MLVEQLDWMAAADGRLPAPVQDVKLAYLKLFDAHVRTQTREALLDGQHLGDPTLDDFPYFAKACQSCRRQRELLEPLRVLDEG